MEMSKVTIEGARNTRKIYKRRQHNKKGRFYPLYANISFELLSFEDDVSIFLIEREYKVCLLVIDIEHCRDKRSLSKGENLD